MHKWNSIKEVHHHALNAEGKKIKELLKKATVDNYYEKPQNKGWIGNSIESDWFGIPNNNRDEPDIPELNLEIKVTPIRKTRNGWSAKERLVLNIFDFNEEYLKPFEQASFILKSSLIELMYYEHKKDIPSPELEVKKANLFKLSDLPKEDWLIIKQDWETIINKILEGRADELSDSLTKYLGATTKGSKTEKNMTNQPFSEKKAHRRSFTLKGAYMTQLARRAMGEEDSNRENIIKDYDALKEKSFETIILDNYKPYIGKTKEELAKLFNVDILNENDKASSAKLARKMLNVEKNIEDTEEFKKANIAVKILTIESNKKKATEHFKITIPDNTEVDLKNLINETWENSILRDYLSSCRFLLVVYKKEGNRTIFKGAKFWRIPLSQLDSNVKEVWEETKNIFFNGIELTYKPTNSKKGYEVKNSLPKASLKKTLHMRPSSKYSSYRNNTHSVELPIESRWINRPKSMREELTSNYITKQAWWLNNDYMYNQVKDLLNN